MADIDANSLVTSEVRHQLEGKIDQHLLERSRGRSASTSTATMALSTDSKDDPEPGIMDQPER